MLVIVLIAVSFASCAKNEVPSGMKAAYNPAAPYRLYVPKGWTVDNSSAKVASAFSRDADPLTVTVTMTEASGESIKDYFASYAESFRAVYSDFTESEPESTLIDGKAAYKFAYSGKLREKTADGETAKEYGFVQYIASDAGMYCIITFASGADKLASYSEDIADIIESFRFASPSDEATDETTDTPTAPSGMKYASNDVVDYDFFIPESWQADMSTGAVTAYTDEGKTSVSVVAWDVGYMVGIIDDWRRSYTDEMTMISPDFTEISSEETKMGGYDGMKYTSRASVGGTEYEYTQIAVARKYMIYLLTYTTTEGSADHTAELDRMISSLSFDD